MDQKLSASQVTCTVIVAANRPPMYTNGSIARPLLMHVQSYFNLILSLCLWVKMMMKPGGSPKLVHSSYHIAQTRQ